MNYTVSNGTGTRRVVAESKLEALTKATGRDASRFAILEGHPPTSGYFKEVACAVGHQSLYVVKPA
jgi:hypothetical protein